MTNAIAPMAARTRSSEDGSLKRFSARATIAATVIAARSMITASMPKAIARVTRPV